MAPFDTPTADTDVGLFADQEIRLVDGPVFLGNPKGSDGRRFS